MFEWHRLPEGQRKDILNEVSSRTGYPTAVVEKDWWVTVALMAVFATKWADQLVFKGGTSLSKGWKLIERFSEDIDLAIDKSVLGFGEQELTKSQIRKLREKSAAFIEHEFMPALQESLLRLGIDPARFNLTIDPVETNDADPRVILLNYTSLAVFNPYIRQKVLIEIGARSLREPCEPRPITSFISDAFPGQPFADTPFIVEVVRPERTFLEKICLLHEEFSKEPSKRKHERLSRHLSDIYQVMNTTYGRGALEDKELFLTIVAHREKYTALRGITYERHTYDSIDFIPPSDVLKWWKEDYQKMTDTMIYGEAPTFDKLMASMQELKARFRAKSVGT